MTKGLIVRRVRMPTMRKRVREVWGRNEMRERRSAFASQSSFMKKISASVNLFPFRFSARSAPQQITSPFGSHLQPRSQAAQSGPFPLSLFAQAHVSLSPHPLHAWPDRLPVSPVRHHDIYDCQRGPRGKEACRICWRSSHYEHGRSSIRPSHDVENAHVSALLAQMPAAPGAS